MKLFRSPSPTTVGISPTSSEMQLHGRVLLYARLFWIVTVLLALVVYAMNLLKYDQLLQILCSGDICIPSQLTSSQLPILYNLGLSLNIYALLLVIFNVSMALVWCIVGLILFVRRSRDWMALLVSLTLMIVGAAPPAQIDSDWPWLTIFFEFLSIVLLFVIFCLFPNGKFTHPWMRWILALYALLNVGDFFPDQLFHLPVWLLAGYFLLIFGCIGVLGITQIYRYRYISNLIERQQIKWVIFSCIVIITGEFMLWLSTVIFPGLGHFYSLYDLFFNPLTLILILLIPISLGLAILRYRLWDIDLLLNRALVYGAITTILALIYVGSILSLSALLHLLTGQQGQSPLVVTTSTLAIASLFQPLRRRVQYMVDRRFYRGKYDAVQTLTAFSVTLRSEFDLRTLTEQLIDVVEKTMQPTHISLWLRPLDRDEPPSP